MFVGHGLLAFAVVALLARQLGAPRERALSLGLIAGAFGFVPDVDMVYAPVRFLGSTGPISIAERFWAASTVVHRTVTHSLPVGCIGALAGAAWVGTARTRHVGIGLVGLLCLGTALHSGGVAGAVMVVFAVSILLIASVARRFGFGPRSVFSAALVGLLSHPFGDLFTGTPPQFAYPLGGSLIDNRIALSHSPTLHLLGAMGIELAVMWLAVLVVCSLTNRRLYDHIEPWAVLGIVYAVAVPAIPPPTLDTSFPFVLSVLGVGVACGVPRLDPRRPKWLTAAATGLTAVTVAALAYAAAYCLM